MTNSEPVYAFGSSPSPSRPDLSTINQVLSRHMRLDVAVSDISPDSRLLELRHHLLEKIQTTPECASDVEHLVGEVNDLVAGCIYSSEDRSAIAQACLDHWKKTLLPKYTVLCLETVLLKLRDVVPLDTRIDLRFALERGIKNQISWQDLLLEEIGPAITRSHLSPETMRQTISLVEREYTGALRVATL